MSAFTTSDTMAPIVHHHIETKQKHLITVFFNRDTDLLVVDVVHKNEKGGNEIVRRKLDYKALLPHCK